MASPQGEEKILLGNHSLAASGDHSEVDTTRVLCSLGGQNTSEDSVSRLTILHLSDLHWDRAKANDQRIVVDALIEDLRVMRREGIVPDLVLFTGDLVQAGEDPASFAAAHEHFLARLKREAPSTPLIVVPGNHDIQRATVREAGGFVETGLKANLASVDSLNAFIDDLSSGSSAANAALERLNNFEAAYSGLGCHPAAFCAPLLKVYKFDAGDVKVGVAVLNTAWRATGGPDNVDRHALLIGERNIDLAAEQMNDCDLRIAAFHHPLDWLADFDSTAVTSRLYQEFDLLAYGHTHASFPEYRITPIGSAVISQAGCLYQHREYFNGYQFIRYDLAANEVEFIIRTYFNRPRRMFDKAINLAHEGRVHFTYTGRQTGQHGPVEKFLRTARPVIRQAAAEQVNIVEAVSDLKLDPKEAFICPPLTVHRTSSEGQNGGAEDEVAPEDILRAGDNYLIVGPRESGKSTLAHYFAVLASEGAIDRPRIPAVIDFRPLRLNRYGLIRAIATYFGAAKEGMDVEARLNDGDFLIIVDNFTGKDAAARKAADDLVKGSPNCRWILLADAKPGSEVVQEGETDCLSGFKPVHIQTLPRKSIRALSTRWCEPIGIDGHKAFSAVMAQLSDANLPRTGYMVTLLLWALYQERKFERVNEALLLTYVIDHLLGKADFAQLQQSFDPTSKEITLQHLATSLRSAGGVLPKNDVLEALISFFRAKGLQYDAAEILRQLIDCGLLKAAEGLVSFKYRCFEEYFFANYLRNDPQALNDTLQARMFLSFSRELELLSGLRRQNKDILDALEGAILSGRPAELDDYPLAGFDQLALTEAGVGVNRRRLDDIRQRALSADQIDDLMDATEREVANRANERKAQPKGGDDMQAPKSEPVPGGAGSDLAVPMQPWEFISSVDLLGKVARNSEFSDLADKVYAVKLHLKSTAEVMLLFTDIIKGVLEEFRKSQEESADKPYPHEGLRYVVVKWFVIVTSLTVSQQLGSETLFQAFDEVLAEAGTSTAEKVLLCMVLLDLSHPKWLAVWTKQIEEANGNRFILDTMMDRLWHVINTKFVLEPERKRIEAAAEKIEQAFGIPKSQRSAAAAIKKVGIEVAAKSEEV